MGLYLFSWLTFNYFPLTHFLFIKWCPHRVSHIWAGSLLKGFSSTITPPWAFLLVCVSPETRGKSKDMASISFPLNQADVGHLLRALGCLSLFEVLWIFPTFTDLHQVENLPSIGDPQFKCPFTSKKAV